GGKYGTAVKVALINRNVGLVKLHLKYGADPNAQCTSGKCGTALQVALYWGRLELVMPLLEKGADMNAPGTSFVFPRLF
ncbi:hypothetical protein B0H14DRAFT_2366182, partial [Mycena olivaceomarginata]